MDHPLRGELEATLAADARVVAWGLVGSYGRGDADRWSDLDVLVGVADAAWDDDVAPDVWPPSDVVCDSRGNVRDGAHSTMTIHVRDGWPFVADWYLHPVSRLAPPADCSVVADAPGVARVADGFAAWNARGRRRDALVPTPDGGASFRLRMAEVVAKARFRGDGAAEAQLLARLGAATVWDLLPDADDGTDVTRAVRRLVTEAFGPTPRPQRGDGRR